MTRKVSAAAANVVLAAGVALAVAIAVGFVLTGREHAASRVAAVPAHRPSVMAKTTPPPAPVQIASLALLPPPPAAIPDAPPLYQPPVPMAMVEITHSTPPAPPETPPKTPTEIAVPSGSGSGLKPPSLTLDIRHLRPPPRHLRRRHAAPKVAAQAADRNPVRTTAYDPVGHETGHRIDGAAIVTATLGLNVAGRSLRLYGVAPPEASDLCVARPHQVAQDCADASREALAGYLAGRGPVSCRMLAEGAGGRIALPAVCATAEGKDVGRYLVAHGFALPDPNDIVDYRAAENRARAEHRGLWGYR